jgi:hypothetical protein
MKNAPENNIDIASVFSTCSGKCYFITDEARIQSESKENSIFVRLLYQFSLYSVMTEKLNFK